MPNPHTLLISTAALTLIALSGWAGTELSARGTAEAGRGGHGGSGGSGGSERVGGVGGQPDDREDKIGVKTPNPELTTFRAGIPRGNYQTLVVSPRSAPRGVDVVTFIIRSRDGMGGVSDFTFFVPVGTTQTLNFPGGWSTQTDAVLFVLDSAEFAAWGVTSGAGANGGSFIRFLPVGRDTSRDADDREREREFEGFLREQQRNK